MKRTKYLTAKNIHLEVSRDSIFWLTTYNCRLLRANICDKMDILSQSVQSIPQHDQQGSLPVLWIPSDSSQVCLYHYPQPYCANQPHLHRVSPSLVLYLSASQFCVPQSGHWNQSSCRLWFPHTSLHFMTPHGPLLLFLIPKNPPL